MKNQLKNTLQTPLIGRVYALDDYLDRVSTLPPKRMQRVIVEPMMQQVSILHLQAIRELRGLVHDTQNGCDLMKSRIILFAE